LPGPGTAEMIGVLNPLSDAELDSDTAPCVVALADDFLV